MKKLLCIMCVILLSFTLLACGGQGDTNTPADTQSDAQPSENAAEPTPEPTPEKVNLTGEWKQVNAPSDTFMSATITDSSIEIYWDSEDDDSKALYWAGTVEIPESGDSFTWNSKNDKEKTSTAILASSDDTKAFAFDGKQISFDVSAMGQTTTVKMEKQG